MAQYIYLIRNGDLYNIGKTEQLELTKKSLAPGKVEAILQTNEATSILKILQNKYAKRVLPGSNYFRLTNEEFIECKRQLEIGQNKNDFNLIAIHINHNIQKDSEKWKTICENFCVKNEIFVWKMKFVC